jgi:ribosome-associated protein
VAHLKKKSAAKSKKPVKKAAKKVAAKKVLVKKLAPRKPVVKKSAVQKPAPKAAAAPKRQGMPEQLLAAALKVLDERQADQIVAVALAGRSSLADYMIIASGRAGRQIAAIADHLREAFLKLGVRQVQIEGQSKANWVLVDAGDIIIHLFLPEVRKYYDLDSLWDRKPPK